MSNPNVLETDKGHASRNKFRAAPHPSYEEETQDLNLLRDDNELDDAARRDRDELIKLRQRADEVGVGQVLRENGLTGETNSADPDRQELEDKRNELLALLSEQEGIEPNPDDPYAFLDPDALTKLRGIQNGLFWHEQTKQFERSGYNEAELKKAKERAATQFDALSVGYLKAFGIDENYPNYDNYLTTVRECGIDVVEENEWWSEPAYEDNTEGEDSDGDLLTGREWTRRMHDALLEEHQEDQDSQPESEEPEIVRNQPERRSLSSEEGVKERYGAKVNDKVVFSYDTPDGKVILTYQVLGFPKRAEGDENEPVLLNRTETHYDHNGNQIRTVVAQNIYAGDQIKQLGRDVKLFASKKNHHQPIDLKQYWDELIPARERKEGRRKRAKKVVGGAALFAAGFGANWLMTRYGNDISGILDSARDFLGLGTDASVLKEVSSNGLGEAAQGALDSSSGEGLQEAVQPPIHPEIITADQGDSLWNIADDMLKEAGVEATPANIDKVKDALVANNETYTAGDVVNGINEGQEVNLKPGWRVIEQMR